MKSLIVALLLSASTLFAADGVFYVNNPTEAHFIAQNGATTTNQLIAGSTTTVGLTLAELCPTQKTTVYLAGGPTIVAEAGAVMTINAFDIEVKNLTNPPCLALFGAHNLSIMLSKGSFTITYPVQDESSTCAIVTPIAMYQLNVGKFMFQVSDQKSLVYVLDGMMIVHGDKNRKDTTKKGSKAITGQIDAEVATTTRPINAQESSLITTTQTKDTASVCFIVIDGRVRGVKLVP